VVEVFLDASVLEVYSNTGQCAMVTRVYHQPTSTERRDLAAARVVTLRAAAGVELGVHGMRAAYSDYHPPALSKSGEQLAGKECKTAGGCQYNGVCTGLGRCQCFPSWSGEACGTLAVAPAAPANGLRQIYPNGSWTSTWGGSIRRVGSTHYLLAAEIANGCPVKQYTTNSRAALAVSRTGAAGPYTRLHTAIPIEARKFPTMQYAVACDDCKGLL
jgi:hypothetical protein